MIVSSFQYLFYRSNIVPTLVEFFLQIPCDDNNITAYSLTSFNIKHSVKNKKTLTGSQILLF